ncbi:MAG: DUF3775 domain-containing protein [Rhodospirillaceae bacterium]
MDIALETVCYVIHQARELVADLAPLSDEPGRHAPDDTVREDVAEEDGPEAREGGEYNELKEFIDSLSEDEQAELVALTWIGRGTYTVEDWDEAVEIAREEHPRRVAAYLLGQPLLADELEEGLAEFDLSCEDVD